MMANADDFCQFAKLGQTVKIQKCLQSRSKLFSLEYFLNLTSLYIRKKSER